MGGTVSKIFGGGGGGGAPAPIQEAVTPKPVTQTAAQTDIADAARRRVRRAGMRSLLSDTRLSGEQGVQTLGGGNQL
jgi:hypothetical protein